MKFSDNNSNASGRLHASFCSIWGMFALVSVKCLGAHFFVDTLYILQTSDYS